MESSKDRIAYLLEACISGKATAQEEQEFFEWMQDAEEDSEFRQYVQSIWESKQEEQEIPGVDWNHMYNQVMNKAKIIPFPTDRRRKSGLWPRIAAAAVIILALGFGVRQLFLHPAPDKIPDKKVSDLKPVSIRPPDGTRSTLTLANGKVIILESLENGNLSSHGAKNALKINNETLEFKGDPEAEMEYQTLAVPRGSKPMRLTLADGTAVWLNAASSITFPTVFRGEERSVTMTGEAYFEVTKNPGMPFFVNIGQQGQVEVVGTHFNVNAYANEPVIKTTLLEGSVRFRTNDSRQSKQQEVTLRPNQQSQMNISSRKIVVENDVETDKVMAWKSGLFNFNDAGVREVMNQLERWYNIDVVFEKEVPSITFFGKMTKNIELDDLLVILEKSKVRFRMEGRKLIVLP